MIDMLHLPIPQPTEEEYQQRIDDIYIKIRYNKIHQERLEVRAKRIALDIEAYQIIEDRYRNEIKHLQAHIDDLKKEQELSDIKVSEVTH